MGKDVSKPTEMIAAASLTPVMAATASTRVQRRRADWRLGGRAVARWDQRLLLIVLASSLTGVFGALLLDQVAQLWAALASLVVLWVGMAGAVFAALLRARPAGLFKFRLVDVVWGLALGLALRLVSGAFTSAANPSFPAVPTVDGSIPPHWWWSEAVPAVAVAPVLEETFFRAVILVTVYQLFRGSVGALPAAVTALLASSEPLFFSMRHSPH